jgi:predicted lactoylglutathione lyase
MAEDIKRDANASDKQIADATRITNVVNSLRTDLIQEIDEQLNQMVSTGKLQKLYKQGATKMYGK